MKQLLENRCAQNVFMCSVPKNATDKAICLEELFPEISFIAAISKKLRQACRTIVNAHLGAFAYVIFQHDQLTKLMTLVDELESYALFCQI